VRWERLSGTWSEPAWLRRALEESRMSSKNFRRNAAVLITVASVAAAAAAWRAEDRARIAEEKDREGFAQDVALEQAKAQIYSGLEDVVIDFARARSLMAEASALRAEALKAAPAEADLLTAQADVDDVRAGGILDSINPDAFVKGSGTRTISAISLAGSERGGASKFRVDLNFRKTSRDLESEPEFEEANQNFTKSDLDVGFAALAIASAFFFTLAQISRTRATYVYLVGGTTALIASIVALSIVELA
jgi:hypothetical protein